MKRNILAASVLLALLSGCQPSAEKTAGQKTAAANSTKSRTLTMNSQDYSTNLVVNKAPEAAFTAIQNFRGWWSEEIEGPTDELNQTFFYHYKDVHLCKLQLVEVVPNKKLMYLVLDNEFNFVKDKTEWVGTKLIFELTPEAGQTKIVFTHQGLVPEDECYQVCQDAWTSYIQGSLKELIETGKGKPNGKEGGLNDELVKKWGLPDK